MTQKADRNVCAIIVTYNSGHIIENCLLGLKSASIDIIVVDNASTDNTIEITENLGVHTIKNEINQGFGRANNIGARATNCEFLLFINPDLEIESAAIDALLDAAQKYDNAGIIGPSIIEENGRLFLQSRSLLSPDHLNNAREILPNGDCSVPFLSGACMLVRRDIFFEIGGFDEKIFLFYEDDDLCRKACDKGYANIFVKDAIAKHGRGKSSRAKKGQAFKARYHLAWSKIYICRKYGLQTRFGMDLVKNGAKWLLASIVFNAKGKERYGGSFIGALDALRGKSALKHEGIEREGIIQ